MAPETQMIAAEANLPAFAVNPQLHRFGRLRVFAELTKLRITLLSSLSAATGYVVYARQVDTGILTCSFGMLLAAMGACAMNQCQDRTLDGRMQRTRNRPIPAGVLSLKAAVLISILLAATGVSLLWTQHGRASALAALAAVAYYNLLYTYLKRVWAFAVVPGAVIGALPPVIGWTAAGGAPLAPHILALAFFFFIWQVPHFWLLLFRFGPDYRQAGLPSLGDVFSARQLTMVTSVWMFTAGASSLLLPLYLLASLRWVILGLVIAGLWLMWEAARLLRRPSESFPRVFRAINIYALLVMALLTADALFA